MTPDQIRLAVKLGSIAAISIALFCAGWVVHGWKYDAEQFAAQGAKEKAFNAALNRVNGISQGLQTTLDELGTKRTLTTKEIFHETTKTEYRCVVPTSGVSLYNRAAAESAVTGKP